MSRLISELLVSQTHGGTSSLVVHSALVWITRQSQGRLVTVAGVGEETGTLTSKFVLDVYTFTHCIICRVTECWTESPTVGGFGD